MVDTMLSTKSLHVEHRIHVTLTLITVITSAAAAVVTTIITACKKIKVRVYNTYLLFGQSAIKSVMYIEKSLMLVTYASH